MIDQYLSLLRKRRTIRRFKPDPVPQEYVEKILEAGRLAPSGANSQPWDFLVVKDQKLREQITDLFARHHEASKKLDSFPFPGTGNTRSAPVIIVVCGDPRFKRAYPFTGRPENTYVISVAAAIQQMHLAATALGLASSWRSVGLPVQQALKKLLDIPNFYDVFELIPLGFPDAQPRACYRRPLEEMAHYERFDPARVRSDEEVRKLCDHNRPRADIYADR